MRSTELCTSMATKPFEETPLTLRSAALSAQAGANFWSRLQAQRKASALVVGAMAARAERQSPERSSPATR